LRQRLADAPRPGRPRTADGGVDSWIAAVIDTDPRDLGYRSTVWTAPLLIFYSCASVFDVSPFVMDRESEWSYFHSATPHR
jgi:hypothetical protein